MKDALAELVDPDALLREADIDLPDYIKPGTLIFKIVAAWLTKNDRHVAREFRDVFEGWVVEDRRALTLHLATHPEFEARLEALERLVADPQLERVRRNYGFEAAREAIDERRRMLAFADAGSLSPDLTVAQAARVERTIRELDPNDVKVLAKIQKIDAPARDPTKVLDAEGRKLHDQRIEIWHASDPSGHILVSSGCLDVSAPSSVWEMDCLCIVTKLGKWVLTVLDTYLRVDVPLDGHDTL